jgi:hypothetical protein
MFLKIRSVSIGNLIELGFIDKEDEKEYTFEIDLDKVKIKYPEDVNANVPNGEACVIKLRHPPAALFDESLAAEKGNDAYEFIAAKCIDKIFEGDEVFDSEDYTVDELIEYIKDLTTPAYDKIKAFIASTPHLHHEISYKNSKGTDRKIVLTTLTDFFTLR